MAKGAADTQRSMRLATRSCTLVISVLRRTGDGHNKGNGKFNVTNKMFWDVWSTLE